MSVGWRLARNFGWLLGGRVGSALLALAATVLTARSLEPEVFGLVILVHTVAVVIKFACNVKSAGAVIRFGVPLLQAAPDAERSAAWRSLIGSSRRLDWLTALIGGLIGALTLLIAAEPLGVAPDIAQAAWLYVAALLCSATGSVQGALRALDRYRLLGAVLLPGPSIRLAGVGICVALEAPPSGYVLAWASGLLADHLLLLACGARTLGAPYFGGPIRPSLTANPELRQFLTVIYLQSIVDIFPKRVVTLAIGGLFGAEGAGIYRLTRDLAEVVDKPVVMLRQAIFPDLSRLWPNQRTQFLALARRVSLIFTLIGSAFVLAAITFGEQLLVLLAGKTFREGAPLLALLLAAGTLDLGGAALRPASYAMGKATQVFRLQVVAVVLFSCALFGLAPVLGLTGAGWATLIGSAISLGGIIALVQHTAARAGVSSKYPVRQAG